MGKQKRAIAVWNEPTKIPKFIIEVQGLVVNAINNPGYFSLILPPPAEMTDSVTKLFDAEVLVKTRAIGLADDRDIKFDVVRKNVFDWKAFAQSAADHAGDYLKSVAIIHALGLTVKVNGVKLKAPFAITNKKGGAGVAILKMKAVKALVGVTTYEWNYSTDGGHTWIPLLSSGAANQIIEGLVSGTSILAQGRAIADNIAQPWITSSLVVA